MPGVLLDSHALYWLAATPERLDEAALLAIARSQRAQRLFVSPITAWELAIAAQKPAHRAPPDFGQISAARWFGAAVRAVGARVIGIGQRIACEAAMVATDTGHKDPGDCYLIATARMRKLPIMSRDRIMHRLANRKYLVAIDC